MVVLTKIVKEYEHNIINNLTLFCKAFEEQATTKGDS